MSNRKWPGKGSTSGARRRASSAIDLFEQALRGETERSSKKFDAHADRKTLQLCRQVQHALMLAIAGECGDDLLRDISVQSVEPAGGGGHLVVKVIVPPNIPIPEILRRLDDRSGQLRSAIAASISRKRVPTFSFIPTYAEGRVRDE